MEKLLSKKEMLLLSELGEILKKYDAMLQCGDNGYIEVLVFETDFEQEDAFLPVRFHDCMDETDIKKMFDRNDRAMKVLGIERGSVPDDRRSVG